MADYWLKLYVEILDDPKMMLLPDRLFRRAIEVMLLAKKINKDGQLPNEKQIAWMLRLPLEEIIEDLQQLAEVEIVTKTDAGWIVTHFATRQAPSPVAERKQRERDRQRHEQYQGDVTNRDNSVTQNQSREETETEPEQEGEPEAEAEPEPERSEAAENSGWVAGVQVETPWNIPLSEPERTRAVTKALFEHGIRDPARSELTKLPHVNPTMIEYHCRNAPNIAAAIVRIRENWDIPEQQLWARTSSFIER